MRIAQDPKWLLAGALGVAVLVAATVVFFTTRGSDSGRSSANDSDPGNQETPGADLLSPEDLPGEGWAIVSERTLSSFAEAPEAFVPASPELPECFSLRKFEADLLANDTAFRSGAVRALTRGSEPGALARVTHIRVTFDSPESASAAVEAARSALAGTSLNDCIAATARRSSLELSAVALAPLAVPDSGVSHFARFEADSPDIAPATQGLLWWSEGADLVAVVFATTGEALTEPELRAAAAVAVRRTSGP